MAYVPAYNIAIDKQDIVVRFNREAIDQTALGKFLDYVELESIRKRSQLTEDQASALADEIDRAVWENIKHIFTEA